MMSLSHDRVYHTIETPRSSPGAIAMIRVVHPDPSAIGLIDPAMGQVRLAKLFDLDEGVIVRWDENSIVLMAHGGVAIVRAISDALAGLGVAHIEQADPCSMYREAQSEIEAWMLWGLSQSASPLAIDVLLDQPARWAQVGVTRLTEAGAVEELAPGKQLAHLIQPPTVAAVGRANVGKSTLINALVGEQVAIVADLAGTTRDHVGVLVDLGGLVVRWIDTPGIDERIDERVGDGDEIKIAMEVIARADLIVHCIDSANDPGELDARIGSAIGLETQRVRVGMRSDLVDQRADVDASVDVSVGLGGDGQLDGVGELVGLLREALVPSDALVDVRPWRFWDALAGGQVDERL